MDEAKREAIEKAVVELGGEWPDIKQLQQGKIDTLSGHGDYFRVKLECGHLSDEITRAEFDQVKAEMQNKPSWGDAPEWAEWLAQGEDGEWYWFDLKPSLGVVVWKPDEISEVRPFACGKVVGDWRNTLEERPSVHTGTNVKIPIVSDDDEFDIQPTFFADAFEVFNPATGVRFGIGANGESYTENSGETRTNKPSNNWHERGELPPVGEVVRFKRFPKDTNSQWGDGEILGYHDDWVWIKCDDLPNTWELRTIEFKPLRTEYDELVAAAEAAIETETGEPANSRHVGVLVRLGWRPPKN